MVKFLLTISLGILFLQKIALAEITPPCTDDSLECWQQKADAYLADSTKTGVSKEDKNEALKGLQDACRNLIDKKLKEVLEKDNKKLLNDALSTQSDLAVLRTYLAFLVLQDKYNKPGPGGKGKAAPKSKDEPVKEGEQVELEAGISNLQNSLSKDVDKEGVELLTDFFKFVKGVEGSHKVPESDMHKLLTSLTKVSKKANYSNADAEVTGSSSHQYQMTDMDVTLMEQMLTLDANKDKQQQISGTEAAPKLELKNSLLDKAYDSLRKNFKSRNFVESDSAEMRENIRHKEAQYTDAKKALAKFVDDEMKKYFGPEKTKPGHNCNDYFKKSSGQKAYLKTDQQNQCMDMALREALAPNATNNLQGLIDYLNAKTMTFDPNIKELGAEHARTMFAKLSGCSIEKKGPCCKVTVTMHTEHLPGESPDKAEWFISGKKPEKCKDDGVEKFKSPNGTGDCKSSDSNKASPVNHKGKVHHDSPPVSSSILLCSQPDNNALSMYGSRGKASEKAEPMAESKSKPAIHNLAKNPDDPEEKKYHDSNWREIKLNEGMCQQQYKDKCGDLGSEKNITVTEDPKKRKLGSAYFKAAMTGINPPPKDFEWECPSEHPKCIAEGDGKDKGKGEEKRLKRFDKEYQVEVFYKIKETDQKVSGYANVPKRPNVKLKISKDGGPFQKDGKDKSFQKIKIEKIELDPKDENDMALVKKEGELKFQCDITGAKEEFKLPCKTTAAKLEEDKSYDFEITDAVYFVRLNMKIKGDEIKVEPSNIEQIDKWNLQLEVKATEKQLTEKYKYIEPELIIKAEKGAPDPEGTMIWKEVELKVDEKKETPALPAAIE